MSLDWLNWAKSTHQTKQVILISMTSTMIQLCGGGGLLIKKGIEIVDIRNELMLLGKLDDDIHYLVENKWIEIRLPGIKKKTNCWGNL